MDDEKSTPQGPVDPHGQGGIDAPAPPGGPQRTDAPAGRRASSPARCRDRGPGPALRACASPPGGSVAPEDIHDRPDTHTDARDPEGDPEKEAQLENAGTSLDEPSDGSGNE